MYIFSKHKKINKLDKLSKNLPSLVLFKLPQPIIGIILPIIIILIWHFLALTETIRSNLLPPPQEVINEILILTRDGSLFSHILITLSRVFYGFIFGAIAATILGVLTGVSPLMRRFFDPTIQALKAVPSLAWVPLFILWFGIFEDSKIALISVGVFFPIYLNLMMGIRQIDKKMVEVAHVYNLNSFQTIRWILLPGIIPEWVTGLRSGLALGWMFVIAAELMGASEGLGYLMIDGQMTGRPALIIGALILFAMIGKLTDELIYVSAKPFLKWKVSLDTMQEEETNA
ncbi:ABC transporter permease [Alphaproteobacteria bacterium]|jgi:sulfonate transport system permease protein|nr:ABC transporter permease [Alphaproteobacteria bacterium]MDC3273378.1 ABC transporter permease [Alphaproteobacteria bacterium]MDG1883483.1 ABC transporter permease [Alphaproteobacteria bacterium]|tara:strand:- start:1053 stop:1913 length:861 start_codon:yes stop_codon:yes gene_type:complete